MLHFHLLLYTIIFSEGVFANRYSSNHEPDMGRMSGGTTSAASGIHGAYSSYDSQQTEEQRLLYHLLRQYEKAVRPVRNASSVKELMRIFTNLDNHGQIGNDFD